METSGIISVAPVMTEISIYQAIKAVEYLVQHYPSERLAEYQAIQLEGAAALIRSRKQAAHV